MTGSIPLELAREKNREFSEKSIIASKGTEAVSFFLSEGPSGVFFSGSIPAACGTGYIVHVVLMDGRGTLFSQSPTRECKH